MFHLHFHIPHKPFFMSDLTMLEYLGTCWVLPALVPGNAIAGTA